MKGNLRLKKLPCSSHHKKYLIGQYKSVSISGASWRARMTDIWQDLQSWSCLAPQPDGRHLIIQPRRCIILVLRENFLPPPPPPIYCRIIIWDRGQANTVQSVLWIIIFYLPTSPSDCRLCSDWSNQHYLIPVSVEVRLFIIWSGLTCWHSQSDWAIMTRYLFPLLTRWQFRLQSPRLTSPSLDPSKKLAAVSPG